MPPHTWPQRLRQPQRDPERRLTEQQERFCREWMLKPNGTQAAIRAGYAPNSARQQASRLLGQRRVRDYIAQLRDGHKDRPIADRDRIAEELEHLAFARLTDLLSYDERGAVTVTPSAQVPPESQAALKGITQRVREYVGAEGEVTRVVELRVAIHDKRQALESLARLHRYLDGPTTWGGEARGGPPAIRPT